LYFLECAGLISLLQGPSFSLQAVLLPPPSFRNPCFVIKTSLDLSLPLWTSSFFPAISYFPPNNLISGGTTFSPSESLIIIFRYFFRVITASRNVNRRALSPLPPDSGPGGRSFLESHCCRSLFTSSDLLGFSNLRDNGDL